MFEKILTTIWEWIHQTCRRIRPFPRSSEVRKEESGETEYKIPEQAVPKPKEPPLQPPRRRRRENLSTNSKKKLHNIKPPREEPELTCKKLSGRWELVLFVPESCRIEDVQQSDTSIPSTNDEEYYVPIFSENLTVSYTNEKDNGEISLFDSKKPLIFRLRNPTEGRKVRGIAAGTKGRFVVFSPYNWKRKGHAPVSPEPCVDSRFQAHFFYSGGDDMEDIGGFEEYPVITSKRLKLKGGTQIFDDSQYEALYVGEPPQLEIDSNISYVQIGEEKSKGWAENFKREDFSLQKVLYERQGRFFIRIYDYKGSRVDSEGFRYCRNLQKIILNNKTYSQETFFVPSLNGYLPVALKFLSISGETIYPESKDASLTINEDGTVTIPPHKESKEIIFVLDGNVDIRIRLPWIWWRLDYANSHSDSWQDTPVAMTREEFQNYAAENATLKFLLPGRIKSGYFKIGFEDNLNRKLSVTDGLPLRNFIDYKEVRASSNSDVSLRIKFNEETILSLIHIAGTKTDLPAGKVSQEADKLIDYPSPSNLQIYASVKYNLNDLRRGKGFSCDELKEVGLSIADAKHLGVPFDKRRRSKHLINLKNLEESLKDARAE